MGAWQARIRKAQSVIGVIDYGLGNVSAFIDRYKHLKISCQRISDPNQIKNCTKLILPGVGHFDYAINKLNTSGLRNALDECVLERKIPILGVCVGMQMMADKSDEGKLSGLGYLPGAVKLLKNNTNNPIPIPHMGWNTVTLESPYWHEYPSYNGSLEFYFLHSYFFEPRRDTKTLGLTTYGKEFVSLAAFENVIGIQCHPEKSHDCGLWFLEHFGKVRNE